MDGNVWNVDFTCDFSPFHLDLVLVFVPSAIPRFFQHTKKTGPRKNKPKQLLLHPLRPEISWEVCGHQGAGYFPQVLPQNQLLRARPKKLK